jgi:hypothetical protein
LPFDLQFTEADEKYLAALPLSDKARAVVDDFIVSAIANVDDNFRNDRDNRTTDPDDQYFHRDFVFTDRWGDGRCHRINFVLNDKRATMGVLVVVYVEFE